MQRSLVIFIFVAPTCIEVRCQNVGMQFSCKKHRTTGLPGRERVCTIGLAVVALYHNETDTLAELVVII